MSRIAALFFLFLLVPCDLYATTEDAASWLSAQQQVDGGIYSTTDLALEQQATSEVLELEAESSLLTISTESAKAFLESKIDNVSVPQAEFLARALTAGVLVDHSGRNLLSLLKQAQNDDGGFGDKPGFQSTPYDTVFALGALSLASLDSYESAMAVSYLLGSQDDDGSWKLSASSNTTLTAQAVLALWEYRHRFQGVSGALSHAITFLESQKLGSLWESDAETAQALLAALPLNSDPDVLSGSLIDLAARQEATGAWSNDVYTTALVLRSLLLAAKPRVNPDLVSLSGKVIDSDTGLPLPDVAIVLAGNASETVYTDASGLFALQGLEAGNYSLSIMPEGFSGITWSGTLSPGIDRDLGELRLIRLSEGQNPTTGFVQGRITNASSGNPLSDVLISVSGTNNSAVTDSDGRYVISGVNPGAIEVVANKQGYFPKGGVASIEAGQTLYFSTALSPISQAASMIAGVLTDVTTGEPLSDIAVSLSGSNIASSFTDVSGQYQFDDLVEGETTLGISSAFYHDVTAVIEVVPGVHYDASIALTPIGQEVVNTPAQLSGMVVAGENGPSLLNVEVELDIGGQIFTQFTDDEGMFLFEDLPPGESSIIFRAEGYFEYQLFFSLSDGIAADLGKIALNSTEVSYAFGGMVVDSVTNLPLSNVMVTVDKQSGPVTLMTDQYGQFYLDNFADLEVSLTFDKDDYVSTDLVPFLEDGVITDLGEVRLRYSGYTSYLADLAVKEIDQHGVSNDPATLKSAGLLGVTIQNLGVSDTSGGFDVVAFYDVDQDGALGDSDLSLGELRVEESIDTELHISIPVDGTLPYRDAPISVFVDINSEIVEADETNNYRKTLCQSSCTLIEADFEGGVATGWTEIPNHLDSTSAWSVSGGVYDSSSSGGGAFIGDTSWEKYTAETRIRFPEGATADAGLLFRYQDLNNWYQLRLRDGLIRIISRINGEIDDAVQTATVSVVPNEWYTLKVEVDGQNVKTYLNDQLIFNYSGLQLSQGTVGYMDDGVHVQYDDFTVSNCHSAFSAQQEWHWRGAPGVTGSVLGPAMVGQLTDDNNDGRIGQADIPDVIFHAGSNDLVAVSGASGETIWATSQYSVSSVGSPSIADIDGDGIVEILAVSSNRRTLFAFEHTGEFKWSVPTGPSKSGPRDALSIADLNHDGSPEIIHGRHVFSADGTLLWEGTMHHGGETGYGIISIAADIDLQGDMEVIAGATAYNSDGSVKWHQSSVGSGFNAIGNFDEDDFPEIVLIASGRLYLLEHTGEIKWGPVSISGGTGGAPTVADVDGDGEPEIGIAGSGYYSVFETDGSLKWRYRISDYSSSRTGSTVFDFQADGSAELVYADEYNLRVFNGATGEVLLQIPNRSGTTLEYPVIADIDNDGSAEIIFGANAGSTSLRGLKAYGSVNNDWVGTRSIWNQHAYHISNINDDGTVPTHEEHSWQNHNTYRLNRFPGAGARDIHDLTLALLTVVDNGTGNDFTLTARIGNAGSLQSPPTSVVFYRDSVEGERLGEVQLTSLARDSYTDIALNGVSGLSRGDVIVAAVNYTNRLSECNGSNNAQQIAVDAVLGRIDVTTDKMAYLSGADVLITATVSNVGLFASDYQLLWHIEDAQGNTVAELLGADVIGLASGAQQSYDLTWNTEQYLAGAYRVEATLLSSEGTELHIDQSDFIISATDVDGNLAAAETSLFADSPVYQAWDTVQISGQIRNAATNAALPDAIAILTVISPVGDVLLEQSYPIGSLSAQAIRNIANQITLVDGMAGIYIVRLDLVSNVDGSLLSMSATTFSVEKVALQSLLGTTTASLTTVERGKPISCTDELVNRSSTDTLNMAVNHLLLDTERQLVIQTSTAPVSLAPGQTHHYVRSIDTSGLQEGGYSCVQQVILDGQAYEISYDGFTVTLPPIEIAGGIGERGRILILLDDPAANAPNNLSALQQQHDYLRGLLDEEGYSYTIVFNADDFETELATGLYHSYALMSEQVTLLPDTEQILAEAVNSGAGLLISGAFNRRNNHIERALGIYVSGQEAQADGILLPEATLSSDWPETIINPDIKLDFDLCGARLVGSYINPVKGGKTDEGCYDLSGVDPAVAEYHYGEGRGVYVGFDALDEAVYIGGNNAYTELLRYGFAAIQPDAFTQAVGEVVPVTFTISTDADNADLNLSFVLPHNLELVDSLPGFVLVDEQQRYWAWQGGLVAGEPLEITLYVQLLDDNASTLALNLEASRAGSVIATLQNTFTFEPLPEQDELSEGIALLQALTQQGASNNVDLAFSNASSALSDRDSGDIEGAISHLLQALGKLANESSDPTQQARLLLDKALFELLALR
ncbi:carboxypeptidase regulatory-like domain-containing protein [Porticoccus sp.]